MPQTTGAPTRPKNLTFAPVSKSIGGHESTSNRIRSNQGLRGRNGLSIHDSSPLKSPKSNPLRSDNPDESTVSPAERCRYGARHLSIADVAESYLLKVDSQHQLPLCSLCLSKIRCLPNYCRVETTLWSSSLDLHDHDANSVPGLVAP
jgi:hypothetical protein